ncbi:hypothetical protein DERF_011218 [Dermatophagoides farinae]|uniref:Uncharacterized protein n=1 Tax=Dermatophagoides farinae TaxID=6954 RepID=A0A922HVQ5_DERFA|nr:hypothetical protein DERF_011218 [Dermatophagoides farinae]
MEIYHDHRFIASPICRSISSECRAQNLNRALCVASGNSFIGFLQISDCNFCSLSAKFLPQSSIILPVLVIDDLDSKNSIFSLNDGIVDGESMLDETPESLLVLRRYIDLRFLSNDFH